MNSANELLKFVEDLKRQWMATVDAMIDPIMMVTPHYEIIKANKAVAKLAGEDVKDIIGKKCYEVFAKKKQPCKGCKMMEAAATSKACSFELKKIRSDMYFEVSSQPIYNKNELEGVVQVYRDRTEAKSLSEQLLQSEKLASIGLLAGGIAHEINNPLGGILIFSQILLKEVPKNLPYYDDIKEIELATHRCKDIVERLLDFARAQPLKDAPKADKRVSITKAVKSALRFAKVHTHGKEIEIIEKMSKRPMMIECDQNRIIQLFLNLFQNAIHAMQNKGMLTIRSKSVSRGDTTWSRWEIKDTGMGIKPENLRRIFDPFFTTKEPGEGTGLGLSICYGICKELGGSIEVESTVGQGSCFRVYIPLDGAR